MNMQPKENPERVAAIKAEIDKTNDQQLDALIRMLEADLGINRKEEEA